MNTKNSISYFFVGRRLCSLLCIALLAINCAQSPKINTAAEQEAETLANDAIALYKKSQQSVSFDNKYTWQGAIDVNDAKTRNEKFISAAKDLESARDKFLQASTKMTEALNGQKAYDNEQATRLSRKSNYYKMWAEMAELESKALRDSSKMTVPKAIHQKLSETQEKRDNMNKNLMESIKVAG